MDGRELNREIPKHTITLQSLYAQFTEIKIGTKIWTKKQIYINRS
jgi:hypothetical protein